MSLRNLINTLTSVKLTRAWWPGKPYAKGICLLSMTAVLVLFPDPLMAVSIKVTWDPARVKSGGVVVINVHSPVRLMAAEAATGRDRYPLIKVREGTYAALVGVAQGLAQASMPVDFALFPAQGGPPYRIRADLKIKDSGEQIPRVQKLSLPSGMVDLSRKRIEQVRLDNRVLGGALTARSRVRYWTEGFLLPVQGRVTTRFGTGRVLNGKERSPHSGVDIAGRKGTPVKASNSGKVLLAEDFYLTGNTVVVDHGWGVSTIYAHLDRINAREGEEVKRGQVLGTVGATGRATGPHLHFGAFIRGAKVDPLQLVETTQDLVGGS